MKSFEKLVVCVGLVVICAYPAYAQKLLRVTETVSSDVSAADFAPTKPLLEAVDTFELIELYALNAREHAAALKSYFRQPTAYSWISHAAQLNRIRIEVNDIANALEKLDDLDVTLLPRQQLALKAIRPDETVLVDSTEMAIEFINENQGTKWNSEYETYISEIYDTADGIAQAADMAESRLNVQGYLEKMARP